MVLLLLLLLSCCCSCYCKCGGDCVCVSGVASRRPNCCCCLVVVVGVVAAFTIPECASKCVENLVQLLYMLLLSVLRLLPLRRYADYAVVAYNVANAVASVVLLATPASRRDALHGAQAVADAAAGAVVIAENKNRCCHSRPKRTHC